MKHLPTSILILFILFGGSAKVLGQSSFNPSKAEYLWPTNASHYLTSTFGETRTAHFHAALDLKTWGRRGYEVYATRDGIVDRITIGPRGYGKVLYLKHKDGSYSVYAHLLSFNDELQHFADSVRISNNYSFEIDQFSGWVNRTIKQGELIGYSGASGIGPPHLHFELRTPDHKPFNPLLTNLSVKDNIAPQITGISVEPFSHRSTINGSNKIHTQNVWGGNSSYQTSNIRITGPVGLGINVFDQSNGVRNSYAVYELGMRVDGRQMFHAKMDSFSYQETGQMFIDRIYPLLKKQDEGYQRLFVANGNTLPFYTTSSENGILNLAPGKHRVTITAADYFGNRSSVSFSITVLAKSSNPAKKTNTGRKTASGSIVANSHTWSWFPDWVTLSEQQFSTTTITIDSSDNISRHQNGWTLPLQNKDPLFMNIQGTGPTIFRRITPNMTTFLRSADTQSFAIFPKHTFYDTVSVGMAVQKASGDSISVELIPEIVPQQGAFTFYLPKDSMLTTSSSFSFYKLDRFDEDEKWELIPTSFTDKFIKGEVESLGTFVLKSDTIPPKLNNPRLKKRPDGHWVILIDAQDNLSGIAYQKTKITVNGQEGIPEYAPEDNQFVYYHPNFTPTNVMNIKITTFDKVGNKRTTTFELRK
ncbi:Peptidase family M23 [Fodinibius salinus]|uniref:Peptidase family M23 n=1 Tax=Fodinibius salinus TaxID=860790 RepID=A0A5D3YLX6_9BACT|nr:M23 family metallopeptidase [Fodinibius salinus]TYP94772.1 Peptidase family M23 [Fodinibius salinus]